MTHSEDLNPIISPREFEKIAAFIKASKDDAQIILWVRLQIFRQPWKQLKKIQNAFDGVPNETRKTFEDGTNIFERVLPGRDRMYPDTDSEPYHSPMNILTS